MSELTADFFVSVDGFAAGENGRQDCFGGRGGPETGKYVTNVLSESQVMVMGRKTYEILSRFWPTAPPGKNADRMNSLPKVVFSKTLEARFDPLAA